MILAILPKKVDLGGFGPARLTAVLVVHVASPTSLAAATPWVVFSLFPPIFGVVLLAALVPAPPLAAPAAQCFVIAARDLIDHASRLLSRAPPALRHSGIRAPSLAILSDTFHFAPLGE